MHSSDQFDQILANAQRAIDRTPRGVAPPTMADRGRRFELRAGARGRTRVTLFEGDLVVLLTTTASVEAGESLGAAWQESA